MFGNSAPGSGPGLPRRPAPIERTPSAPCALPAWPPSPHLKRQSARQRLPNALRERATAARIEVIPLTTRSKRPLSSEPTRCSSLKAPWSPVVSALNRDQAAAAPRSAGFGALLSAQASTLPLAGQFALRPEITPGDSASTPSRMEHRLRTRLAPISRQWGISAGLALPSPLPFPVAAHASGLCTRGRLGRKAKPSGRAARGLDCPAFFPSGPGPPS